MRIINIVGARPNFMKIAPVMEQMNASTKIDPVLLHTGQHYDYNMSEGFFKELMIPEPDIYLEVGSDTHAKQVAKIMAKFDDICDDLKPDAIMVVGDVNSTMACSLVAAKKGIKIVHLEAGIRSWDRAMPEEINRMVTDSITDYLLPPSEDAIDNLLREGHSRHKIKLVGNIMIDTLMKFQDKIDESIILSNLKIKKCDYAAVTLHRPSNVDNKENFLSILQSFEAIQRDIKIVFPIHPRTKKMIKHFGLNDYVKSMNNLIFTEPLGYFDFGKIIKDAAFVMTDSGGIQEETTVYGVPCITIRENTERPITIHEGTNELAGPCKDKITGYAARIMEGKWKKGAIPALWDGKTAERVVNFLESVF